MVPVRGQVGGTKFEFLTRSEGGLLLIKNKIFMIIFRADGALLRLV